MSFLAPLFFASLAALAVPVLIHMIQRERKTVVAFPSLMFVRKIPYQSFRRQRIRHWFLLLMRCAALILLVAAFARPFVRLPALAAGGAGAGEVVLLVDRSYSMAQGDRWDDATAAARRIVNGLAADDRTTLIFFDTGAAAGPRSTVDRASLLAAIDGAEVGSGATRYGPALKLAEGILAESEQPRLEAVLISDFQKSGAESASGVRFPEGTSFRAVPVGESGVSNVVVAGASFQREYFSGRERVTVSARLANRGNARVSSLPVTLTVEGRDLETLRATIEPHGGATVAFAPFTLGDHATPAVIRAAEDSLPKDDAFYFVVSPGQVVPVLLLLNPGASRESSLYLTRALAIGTSPAFDVMVKPVDQASAADLSGRRVVVLNDTRPPAGQAGRALTEFVQNGGGLLVVLGERSTWPDDGPALLPGRYARPLDREGRGAGLGVVDFSHPVFELFSAPRSGDITAGRFFRYRPIEPGPDATVLARFDDGQPALVERRVGEGRVFVWASTLDTFWNDLALKPVFLPFVHRIVEYLGDYAPPTPWYTAGDVLDLSSQRLPFGARATPDLVALTPSGDRRPLSEDGRAGLLELTEQGFYEVRDANAADARPFTIAVNLDLAESDLTTIDPEELVSSITGRVGGERDGSATARELRPEDLERRQTVWWYLLVGALALFLTETIISNRLSLTALD